VQEYDRLADRTPEQSLNARTSPGACARLELEQLRHRLESLQAG